MHHWASANRCAIFERGYLELIGLVDEACWNPWAKFLGRFEGLHLLALRCENADAAYAKLAPHAPFLDAPVQRERKLHVDGVERTMRFRNIFSRDAMCPEGRYIVIEHQTPAYLWQPALTKHENGALALEEAFVVAEDAGVTGRLAALGGIPSVLTGAEFGRRFGWAPQSPAFAGVTVSFAELDSAARMMETRGVRLREGAGSLWVTPEDANGFVLRMIQHEGNQT